MKKEFFFVLILIIAGVGMILRSFFGDSGDEDKIVENDSGFVVDLVNLGDNNQNEKIETNIFENPEKNQKSDSKSYMEISIMMPRFFYSNGWKNFAQDLYKNQKVLTNFLFVDDIIEYKNIVSKTDFSGADLVLVPYDWMENINAKSFSFQQDLQSAFDSLVSPLVKNDVISFLPFGADPMITYSQSGLLEQVKFANISDLVYDWVPKKAKSFPLFFGMMSEDFDYGFEREYQGIVWYALLHYFSTYKDSSSLSTRIDSNVLQSYNKQTLKEILNLIVPTTSECNFYPSICFQVYNFVGVRFGFLSDLDIVKQYFSKKYQSFSEMQKSQMPFFGLESPVRVRGLVISNSVLDIDNVNAVYLFLGEYMNKHNVYDLWNSTLSVFSDNDKQLRENEYIGPRGYVLTEGGNYMEILRRQNKFWNMIDYKISAKDYLK